MQFLHIQNKQTLGRQHIPDEGKPYSGPNVMKEKLVITGFLQRDKDMKNKNSLSADDRLDCWLTVSSIMSLAILKS